MSRIINPATEVGVFSSSNSWSGITATEYVKALLSGGVWGNNNPDEGNTINLLYYKLEGNFTDLEGDKVGYKWSTYEWQIAQNVMDSFSDVANISFVETSQLDNANIGWAVLNDFDSGADDTLGYSYLPLPSSGSSAGLTTVNWEIYESFGSQAIDPGSYYHLTFLHELGHSLGLDHPHESNDYYQTQHLI